MAGLKRVGSLYSSWIAEPESDTGLRKEKGDMKKLDRYEKEILSAYEHGDLKSAVTSEASLRRYREYARATLAKNRRVNIRMSSVDLADIQARAAEEGLPYQTLMASVLHKFATGRLRERRSSLASRSRRMARKHSVA
jgi:predicted DNA binding CopG/RHH family protein